MYLEGECFGGSFEKTAGEVVLSGGGNAEKQLWVRRERRGRAELGGAEQPPWLLRVAELVSGPWAGSAAPSSHELPLLLLLALLIPIHFSPQAHVLTLPCLLSLPNISSALPRNLLEVRFKKIKKFKNILCLHAAIQPNPWHSGSKWNCRKMSEPSRSFTVR